MEWPCNHPEWLHRQDGCLVCWRLQGRFRQRLHWFILCMRRSEGTAHECGGCDQSIGSTVSDAIIRSWLWSTAIRVPHWATSVSQCKYLTIDPTFCGSIFSTGRLLAIEDLIISTVFGIKINVLNINFCSLFSILLFCLYDDSLKNIFLLSNTNVF